MPSWSWKVWADGGQRLCCSEISLFSSEQSEYLVSLSIMMFMSLSVLRLLFVNRRPYS